MLSTPMSVSSRRHSIVGKLLHRWNNLSLRIKGFAVVAKVKTENERALLVALIADNPAQMKRLEAVEALMDARPVSSLVTYAKSHPISEVPTELLRQSRTAWPTFG